MRKPILWAVLAAVSVPAVPAGALAQSRAEIRHDRREVQEERRDLQEARRELREDRRDLREDRRDRRRSQYVAPYRGWSYRAIAPGAQLRSGFYGSRYSVDPARYRLRPVGRYQRWIRYGDDLVLVNVRTGRVIQVLRNRYW
jgi:Ni/Co efflux regulator RcnB